MSATRRTLSIAALLLSATLVRAQEKKDVVDDGFVVQSYTVEDGLPSNIVHHLALQPGGYLWLATADGLARFDGVAFTTFDAANAGLRTSRVIAVAVDTTARSIAGPVWFAAGYDDLYRLQHGVVWSLKDDASVTGALPFVTAFARDSTWIRTLDGIWVLSQGELQRRWEQALAPGATSAGAAFGMWRQPDGETWLLQPTGVVHVQRGRPRRYPFPDGWGLVHSHLDADGTLWLGGPTGLVRFRGARYALVAPGANVGTLAATPDGRHWVVHTTTGTWYRFDDTGALAPAVNAPGGVLSTTVAVSPDGAAWFVQGDWLYRETTPVLRLATSAGSPVPLVVGPDGDVWVGGSSGLIHVRRRDVSVVSADEGLSGRNVYPVLAARDGSVWVGLWFEGRHLERLVGDRPTEGYTLPGASVVTSLMEDRRGTLWVGTDIGLSRMEASQPRQVVSTVEACGTSTYLDALIEDRAGRIWAGGNGRLVRGEPTASGWRWTCDVLDGASVRALVETRRGEVLLASAGRGLGRRTASGTIEWRGATEGLPSDNVRDIYEDERGVLWIATEDRGLCRLDRGNQLSLRAGSLACLSEADGLLDNSLHRVLPDDDGRLWLNSNAGIFALARADADAVAARTSRSLTVQAFTEADGLKNREGNGGHQPAGSSAPDGRLYFPTQDGVAIVDPRDVPRPSAPVAWIEGVAVGNRDVPEADWRAAGLTMGPGERDLRLHYTGIALADAEDVRFRVRLVGYEEAWREVGAVRTETFTNLPPGDYSVEVQAGRGGAWSEPARLAVVRRPFLWETGWFRVLSLLAIVGLVALAVRARLQALARRQRQLEATVEARTADLRRANEVKTRFLQNVSHELRTPLALLLGPVRDLRDGRLHADGPQARPVLDRAVTNGERLQRLIDELLLLARIDGDALSLDRSRIDLAAFVRDRVAAFDSAASAVGVQIAVDAPAEPVWAVVDAAKTETVLYNLVGNALKFTPASGRVTVRLARESRGVRLDVADTGVGIDSADLPHLFDRFFQANTEASRRGDGAGIGLALARELVGLHGGTITAESAPGVGTTISVRLPVGTDATVTAPPAPSPPPALAFASAANRGDDPDGASAHEPDDDRPLVLVVDDNADLRLYLASILDGRYQVATASDGADGIAWAVDLVPDVVVSDVMMPGLDGFALLAALKADVRTSHVPVLLLTARADVESRLIGLGAGADAYLAKPFDAAELEANVTNLVENRRRLRAAWAETRTAPPVRGAPPTPDDALDPAEAVFLGHLDDIVRDHLRDADFGTAALADALGMSARQLRRKLKALTGEAPSDYVRRVRLERAVMLLEAGAMSVKEVAWEVGFGSPSGFRTAFREAYGVAPTRYGES